MEDQLTVILRSKYCDIFLEKTHEGCWWCSGLFSLLLDDDVPHISLWSISRIVSSYRSFQSNITRWEINSANLTYCWMLVKKLWLLLFWFCVCFVLFCFVLVWFGLVWFGLVWFGLVWFGLVWCFGLVWFGLVWFGLVWFLGCIYTLNYKDLKINPKDCDKWPINWDLNLNPKDSFLRYFWFNSKCL